MDSAHAAHGFQALSKLVGRAPALLRMIEELPAVAASGAPVLVIGETGTGKELVARALHYLSPRAASPFVAVNCGALPEALIEDELFGHERGAFTSAETRRVGLIQQADDGTLFLDEVGTLAAKAQVDLLRVLQDKKYRAVGRSSESRTNARIIAATNVPLEQLIRCGSFRADLYYRLSVFMVNLPPLRSRKEDIPALAEHFLQKHAVEGKAHLTLSPRATTALMAWDWPGNVRELENAIIRGIHLSHGDCIEERELRLLSSTLTPSVAEPASAGGKLSFRAMKQATIEIFERNYLSGLMSEHHGNISQAARASGKERRDLGKLLKKYQLDPKSFRPHITSLPTATD
ncbi:MAG TPA: sigma-54 dependent transcriptional regulator [Terriglobales bacterium]|jgi:two-component system response regulator GlrR|nr:sigma-54 dependent transcriptional regulator [Terriglobales bacterium]